MKMRGTYRQDQHGSSHRLAGFGTTGFGWIIWGLAKIFATPRPVRIGLSGMLLWVGMVGVSLADPATSDVSNQPAGTIKNPFNPQGYMLEMAAKMKSAGPRDAVMGQTRVQRALPSTAKATSNPSQDAWRPADHPETLSPTTAKPVASGARWLGSGDPVIRQTPTVTSQSKNGLPVWSPARDRTMAAKKSSKSSTGHMRWLTPPGGESTPATSATSQTGWRPSSKQTPAKAAGVEAPTNAIAPQGPTTPAAGQMGWRPSSKPAPTPPAMSEQPMRQATWLAPSASAPQPSASAPQPSGGQPSRRLEPRAPARSASPIRHARWLTPKTPVTPRAIAPQAAPAPTNWGQAANPAPTPAASAPTMGQAAWPSAAPEVAANQTAQQPAFAPMGGQPTMAEQPMQQTAWPTPATQVAQPTMTAQPTVPEQPMRQTAWPTPSSQVAATPIAPQRSVNQNTWPTSGYQAAQSPTAQSPTMSQETWLAPENRAAQRALDRIRNRKVGVAETPVATAAPATTYGAPLPNGPAVPAVAPKQAGPQGSQPSPQTLLVSGGAVNPQMALMATNPTAYAATDLSQAKHFYEPEKTPWTLGADLDKYREHAVKEGSREFGASLGKALQRIGLAVEDTTNVITLGYASDRGQPFRANDGKGLFEDPGRVPHQAGTTIASFGDGLYSVADLVTFDALPDNEKSVYRDNHPIVRPLVFTGRTIGGAWKTTEEIGNAVTWGYFDNVTGSIGMVIEDLIEVLKHAGQAVTNLARAPVHLIGGKDTGADKALDWVLLVPLEFASNVVEMKGIANMDDYETAFADKGVIGSILEFGGSTFIVYRAMDELLDEFKDDDHHSHEQSTETPTEPEPPTPTEPPVVVPDPPTTGGWTDYIFGSDGVISGTRTE